MVKKIATTSPTAKPTKVAAAAGAKTNAPLRSKDEQATDTLMADFMRAKEALFAKFGAPGWKRILCAAVVALCVGVGVGWIAGFAIDWLTLGVLTLTGSAYAGMVVWLLGVVMMVVAAGKLGAMAWDAVITGRADEALSNAGSWAKRRFTGLFGSDEELAHA